MSELPNGWIEVTLGQITSKPQYGYTTKSQSSGSVRYLRTTDLTSGKVNWDNVPYCVDNPADVSKYQLEDRDIVISRAGSVGFHSLICSPPANVVFASYLIRFKPSSFVNERYLSRFLNSQAYWSQITEKAAGVAVQNVNAVKLADLRIPLAPLNEQIRIADKLDSIQAKVDRAQARLDKIPGILKRFRQSVLAAATSGELTREWRGGNDHNWKRVSLGMVGKGFNYGTSAKSQPEGNVPVLRMGNLQGGELDWNDLVYTSDKTEIKKYSLEKGDVLFNRTNSPELVGKTSIYRGEREAIYAGYLIRVKGSDRLNTEFLNIQLNSPHARDYCWQVKTDGVSQSNINAKKLQSYEFDLPEIEEQLEIVRRVSELYSHAVLFERQYIESKRHFDRLSQSALAKAFRGELVEQNPADEPAVKLLERIKKQQLEAPKPARQTRKPAEKVAPSVDVVDTDTDTDTDIELARAESEILALLKKTSGGLSAEQIMDKLTEKTFEQVDVLFTELKRLLDANAVVKVGSGEACTFKAIKR